MKQNRDFTTGSIPVKLTSFMMPILAALILQAMYGAVDLYMVGQFGSTAGLSAVSTGSGIINFVTFTICGLTTGVTVLIGRYLGERKQNEISEVVGGVIWLFGIISVVLTIVVFVFAKELSVLMKAPVEALELTIQYVQICAVGLVFVIAYNVISSIFRGLGNSNLPLLFVAIAALTNMVGDYVLVAIMQMNVAGAAIATIGAQAVSVILSLWIIKILQDLVNCFFRQRADSLFGFAFMKRISVIDQIRHLTKVQKIFAPVAGNINLSGIRFHHQPRICPLPRI